jgi:hypothetical protein
MEYLNKDNVQFVNIWIVKYIPDDVPLWRGTKAAMDKFYYFSTEKEKNEFMDKNQAINHMLKSFRSIGIKHDDNIYPLDKVLH